MNHHLQAILKRQGRRAERRRKRKLRSKLFRERPQHSPKRSDGWELHDYFDRKASERAHGQKDGPGERTSEFTDKVHETDLVHRERMEMEKFQVRGIDRGAVNRYSWGQSPPRAARVVRP